MKLYSFEEPIPLSSEIVTWYKTTGSQQGAVGTYNTYFKYTTNYFNRNLFSENPTRNILSFFIRTSLCTVNCPRFLSYSFPVLLIIERCIEAYVQRHLPQKHAQIVSCKAFRGQYQNGS
jgi:hypothetical protein